MDLQRPKLISAAARGYAGQRASDLLAKFAVPRFQTFHREDLPLRPASDGISLGDAAHKKGEKEEDSGMGDLHGEWWPICDGCLHINVRQPY